ncbi:hypothetical protein CABS01_13803 [Colletotrichum abscissum]|uniref:uncharacterized protein n=1 Tax=Colletotrichum abscissum TaxID=1671311 RepID=UPI0027D6E2F8|nr:uncharacterized protein CABS01_13803 [Colletotrichum abscissum]KAK1484380.1 hypothetical protein CABS01_13803 [Colletotrichum abscissum]
MSGFLLPMVVVMFCHKELLPYSASSKQMEKAIQLGRQNSRGSNGIIYLLCYQGRRLCNYRYPIIIWRTGIDHLHDIK